MVIVARLPWWVGAVLAVASYVLLHAVARQPVAVGARGLSVTSLMYQGLASAGQYVLPIIFLGAAAISAWRNRRAKALLAEARERAPVAAIDGMSWAQFETLVGAVFREMGYRVVETGGGGADGGVDLVLHKGKETFLVQCKQWRASKVGVAVVRELYGVMTARGAAGGFVVTSGSFTDDAKAFADGRHIHLVDGRRVQAWVARQRASAPAPAPAAVPAPRSAGPVVAPVAAAAAAEPACPVCGSAMVRRVAQRGARAGESFWGCSRYPSCRGTRA